MLQLRTLVILALVCAIGLAAGGLVATRLTGTGAVALATHGQPLVLRVTPGEPLRTDPHATVAWSGWPDPLAIVILLGPPLPLVLLARGAWRYHLSLSAAPPPTAPQVRPGQLVGATR